MMTSPPDEPERPSALLAGLAFGTMGLAAALFVLWNGRATGWWVVVFSAGLASFLAGVFFWRVFSSRDGRISFPRAGLAGAFAGALSHPLAWYIAILVSLLTGTKGYGEIRVLGPIDGLWASLVMSFWSLLLIGWITVPAGVLAGLLYLGLHRRLSRRNSVARGPDAGPRKD
ncbi:MAG: hypothetical protein IT186_04150 [Acidobacteria bacterium]|nr:hypothetical protein [Acidobacteriota bacterium]MCK6681208.1 hypothetical protein [Thermoanaerobaculia bacterium]